MKTVLPVRLNILSLKPFEKNPQILEHAALICHSIYFDSDSMYFYTHFYSGGAIINRVRDTKQRHTCTRSQINKHEQRLRHTDNKPTRMHAHTHTHA